jgi:glycosyltransferase involved in cell wall biosynthesis
VSSPVRLVVIGDGPEREVLLTLASKLGLDDRVQWLGRRTNTETRLWMTRALALLVPSEFEQWGLVVNEAWMAPTLVLGSDTVGAIRAAYPHEMRWMMMPAGDVAAWQHALARLIALRPDGRSVLIDETRRLAEKYSLAAHTLSALALINLPLRARPLAPAGWLALAWRGRVAVW